MRVFDDKVIRGIIIIVIAFHPSRFVSSSLLDTFKYHTHVFEIALIAARFRWGCSGDYSELEFLI